MRPAKRRGGRLEFDTTVLAAADGSIAGLLGASPGASIAVPAMLDVLERCFPDRYPAWLPMLKEMVPSLGASLSRNPALYEELRSWTSQSSGARGSTSASEPAALRRSWAKDLDVPTLYALLKLRVEVFVVEQACPYPELDGRDLFAETRHFWLEASERRGDLHAATDGGARGRSQGVPARAPVHQTQRPRRGTHHPATARRARRSRRLPVPDQCSGISSGHVCPARIRPGRRRLPRRRGSARAHASAWLSSRRTTRACNDDTGEPLSGRAAVGRQEGRRGRRRQRRTTSAPAAGGQWGRRARHQSQCHPIGRGDERNLIVATRVPRRRPRPAPGTRSRPPTMRR